MALLDYERLFVKTDKIDSARQVNVIQYEYKDNHYTHDSVDYLEKVKAGGKPVYKFEDDGSISYYICINKVNSDEFKSEVATLGASCYKKLKYLKEPLNFSIDKNIDSAFVSGIVLAHYNYNFLNKDPEEVYEISIINFNTAVMISNAQNFVRFLGDTPANLMTPTLFAEYATKYCTGLEVEVLDREYMKSKNMNLLLGVARGSSEEPKLLKIRYKSNPIISLVGKGITFDTGGISIKPSANMGAMKGDMLGAATVLATIKLCHTLNLNVGVEAIIPLTENMPGGRATKPGDVHVGMAGISVEVDNTDAEGRLILGDALTLAQESQPEYLLDVATLTGAISVALGEDYLGYYTTSDELSDLIKVSSDNTGDLAWRMPLSNVYKSFMKSNVADMKNAGGRKAGSCTAAIFLKEFVHVKKWCHFDIAGVDFDHRNKTLYGSGMTGRGLQLMYEVVKNISERK